MTNPHQHEFRKKPVVIEAFQMTRKRRWDCNEWPEWLNAAWQMEPGEVGAVWPKPEDARNILLISTLHGGVDVEWDDWIIQGVKGELYPCKPDVFEATHDKVNGSDDPSEAEESGVHR